MNTIHVRRQGRVCTVFVDGATNQPLVISSAEDQPTGGFPFTTNEADVRARYPGAQLVFHDEVRPPQPEAPTLSAEEQQALDQKIAAIIGGEKPAPSPQTPAAVQVTPPPASATEQQLAALICAEFESLVRDAGGDPEALRDAETVGTFLVSTFPALEAALAAAASRARAPKERKRFSLPL